MRYVELIDDSMSSSLDDSQSSRASRDQDRSAENLRPVVSRHETCGPRIETYQYGYCESESRSSGQSMETFDSSIFHKEDLDDIFPPSSIPYTHELYWNDALPATSRDFSELFPSSRRLEIRHDDTTSDGNMNLRVDTSVKMPRGEKRKITLFHLRMQDLKHRDFSLRRYCRDSGREVCSTSQKPHIVRQRPIFSRSLSSPLSAFKSKSEVKASVTGALSRQDSGYDSINDGDEQDLQKSDAQKKTPLLSSDMISLDFSNYAHVDIKRKGLKADKYYEFEYWGSRYSWRRMTRKAFGITRVSFHLLRRNDQHIVAHIVPEQLTDDESTEEVEAGGWVPPCSMWISDHSVITSLPDVSDVVVATGIVALVDDSIRRHFHEKEKRQLVIAMPMMQPLQVNLGNLGNMGPKHIIEGTIGKLKLGQNTG